jgi:hypothetical protein
MEMKDHKATAYALLRATFGVVFLFYSIGKFTRGLGSFAGRMQQRFAGKLPMIPRKLPHYRSSRLDRIIKG